MFDDQQSTGGQQTQIPTNLPFGEPEDIFAETDARAGHAQDIPNLDMPENQDVLNKPAVPSIPSALGAGILRPKQATEERVAPMFERPATSTPVVPQQQMAPGMQTNQEVYKIKEPVLTRGLVTVVVLVVAVLILGSGGWWIYTSFIAPQTDTDSNSINIEPVVKTEEPIATVQITDEEEQEAGPMIEEASELSADIKDEQILFGELIDKDADGLDDDHEIDIGTDPSNWDSDGDELGDGDEVTVWGTDPLNQDSDEDGYLDGEEVKNGYNPAGSGKIFNVPTSTEETAG